MNILTFDVEEWFHLLDNDSTRSEVEWIKVSSINSIYPLVSDSRTL